MEQKSKFKLNAETGYFQNNGVDVMAFDDFYPAGHQAGVSIIMHGSRVAANGDIRFEQTQGQWQAVPVRKDRRVDADNNAIVTTLSYPDHSVNLKGFNPVIYPDYEFEYRVTVRGEGNSVVVTVDLDKPIPEEFIGKMCFNIELYPGALFGKPWIMDKKQGIFPRQPNGPTMSMPANYDRSGHLLTDGKASREALTGDNKNGYNPYIADDIIAAPYAVGKRFTVCPDDPYNRLTIESEGASELKLYDGRMNHNNGWFIVGSEVPSGVDKGAVRWVITPNAVDGWVYKPVVQISQVGYHPNQPKTAVIELDRRDTCIEQAILYEITEDGEKPVCSLKCEDWGEFLRYNYLRCDFTDIKKEGLYKVRCKESESAIFCIAADVYDRGVWQPVLEYFLPVQMCHMRVNEKYRVWHDLCHEDDACMAPVNCNHIDGYVQGESTLTEYRSGECVPGLDAGGWHDAGDFDLRIESQAGECYVLALTYEAFGVDYDVTTVDRVNKVVEIHQPDGKNDLLQQIEHGALSIVNGYRSLGRLYRGIISRDVRQYVHLGDPAAMTDGVKGSGDDRWVFTEDNPRRELTAAADLAAVYRVLKGFNDDLSEGALKIAEELYDVTDDAEVKTARIHAAAELYLATGSGKYKTYLLNEKAFIAENADKVGWIAARVDKTLNDEEFHDAVLAAMKVYKVKLDKLSAETPYGIPYRPHIWGAGWDVQRMGFQYFFLHKAYPEVFGAELIYNALNFVLGCHPGSNTASFASGVGAKSATVAYGINRADWSYIPGGVISGTALIRPDFPELLEFPFLWQQTEYVMGGGSSNYMFLVLAVQQLLGE